MLFFFPERIKLVRQIAERHADDGDDNVGDRGPNVQHLDKELQTEIVDEDVDDSHKKIPDNLRPTFQCGTRETDMACHPEPRQEGDGKLEHKGRDVGRESNEAKVEDLTFKDKMVENVVEHPLQSQVQAAASRITEKLKAHHLAERRIEEVDNLCQGAFYPGFYVFQG